MGVLQVAFVMSHTTNMLKIKSSKELTEYRNVLTVDPDITNYTAQSNF